MLAAVIGNGTGRAAAAAGPRAAGKTGTSQGFRDAWFVGFDDRRVVVVWLGNDDGSAMKAVTGGGLAAKIWAAIMTATRGL
jgi:penicillin-binding protein 1A